MVLQAYGISIRIEAIRRHMNYSMGSLYWQYNDAHPSFTWSSVDYYGQWKALHYRARSLYQNVQLFFPSAFSLNSFELAIVNDNLRAVSNVTLEVEMMTFDGERIGYCYMSNLTLPSGSKKDIKIVMQFDDPLSKRLVEKLGFKNLYFRGRLLCQDGIEIARNFKHLSIPS